jgi:L-amino acid N-acyltransferase YncA
MATRQQASLLALFHADDVRSDPTSQVHTLPPGSQNAGLRPNGIAPRRSPLQSTVPSQRFTSFSFSAGERLDRYSRRSSFPSPAVMTSGPRASGQEPAGPHPAQRASMLYRGPIIKGPFDPSKYGKPVFPRLQMEESDRAFHQVEPTTAQQSSSRSPLAAVENLQLQATPRQVHSSWSWDHLQDEYRQASECSRADHQPVYLPRQGQLINTPARQLLQDYPAQTVEKRSETTAAEEKDAKMVVHLNPTTTSEEFSLTSEPGNALPKASSTFTLSGPQTKGRPSPQTMNGHSEYQDMTTSDNYASPQFDNSPAALLKRVQRDAIVKHNMSTHRRNKHNTAFPEVLAYIRRPLAPQVLEVVEYRIEHYRACGNDPAWTDFEVGVEPSFPNIDQVPEERDVREETKRPLPSFAPMVHTPSNRRGNSRWVSNAEVRAPKPHLNSNAWGSASHSETTADSQDSLLAQDSFGVHASKQQASGENNLVGWDGKMQPPPVDWHDRPRFANDSVAFTNSVSRWGDERVQEIMGVNFKVIDSRTLQDASLQQDGIGLVETQFTLDVKTAAYYGYRDGDEDLEAAFAHINPLTIEELDGTTLVDITDRESAVKANETTEMLVQRWIGQKGWLNNKRAPKIKSKSVIAPSSHYTASEITQTPELNVYLRPAISADIPGMTRIYNWYVEHSCRTSEFEMISEADMRGRYTESQSGKLPMIVAIAKGRAWGRNYDGGSRRASSIRRSVGLSHPVQNTNPSYQGLEEAEIVVGWASATDFTASDYVERITAELEVYVDHKARQYGVGKALMDKLLEAGDRGYMPQGECDWHCAPDLQHLYSGGGGRDLNKMYFLVRKWHSPKRSLAHGSSTTSRQTAAGVRKLEDDDRDWDDWLKEWLESFDFKQEGCLEEVGAKHGRL